jgi:uncharacterized membrane protein YhhN
MPILLPAFLLCAVLAITVALAWPEAWGLYAVLKPLTTLLVIAHAWRRGEAGEVRRRALLLGLVLSLIGDVALLWPQQGFLPGLVAFLLAHLAYLVAFTRGVRLAARPAAFVGYAVLAGGVLAVLWPGVPGGLRVPVVAYVLCLAAMAAQTACFALQAAVGPATTLARFAALGGALFLCSDALLAFNRFHTPLPLATLWILGTYWAAQWLIASSLPPRGRAAGD